MACRPMPRDPVTMRVLGPRVALTACGTRAPSSRLATLALAVGIALLLVLATAA
jgi:hypothetical protein